MGIKIYTRTMTNVDKDRQVRDVISDGEFDLLLAQARVNDSDFLTLRNPAILCTARLTGKRREEIAALTRRDVFITNDNLLAMNFILLKKHEEKPPHIIRKIPLDDPLTEPIIQYKEHVDREYPDSNEFWLSVKSIFGNYRVYPNSGLSGRQIYNVIRDTGDSASIDVWPHLFRETAGAEEITQDPTQYGVAKVMNRIDVTERTAWAYMQRHILTVIKRNYQKKEE